MTSVCLSVPVLTHFTISSKFNPYYTYNVYQGDIRLSNNNWLLSLQSVITNENVGKQILGADFTRNSLKSRFTHSYLQYKNDDIILFLGRFPFTLGQSKQYSIIQSDLTPTYDQFRFELTLGNLTGKIFAGQLGSEMIEENRITRLIGGHCLTGHFLNEKLELQIGERIIYTGENRNIELIYLNPAVPYVFANYDDDDLNVDGFNNDNGIIFINGRYQINNLSSTFFEFIMDDYQVYDNSTQNMLGYKFGLEGQTKLLNHNLNWETEYTQIDSWTYLHHGQFTSWQNRGHAIGYPYGTDLRSFYMQTDTWLKKETVKVGIEYIWLEKGANNINTLWGNDDAQGDPFPSKPVKMFYLFEASLLYKTKYVSLQTGYTNKPFPYEIANGLISELQGGIFLSVSLNYHMELNINK